jgi:hypothetical protein
MEETPNLALFICGRALWKEIFAAPFDIFPVFAN